MRYEVVLQSLKQAPDNTSTLSLLGKARVAHKQYAKAIQCFGRVLATAPDLAEVVNNLGAMHQLRGESKRAAE